MKGSKTGGPKDPGYEDQERARIAAEIDAMHAQTARLMGLSKPAWIQKRSALIEASLDRRKALYGENYYLPGSGYELDDSADWHKEYVKLCSDGVLAVRNGLLKPADLARDVLTAFGDVISPSAKSRWEHIVSQEAVS